MALKGFEIWEDRKIAILRQLYSEAMPAHLSGSLILAVRPTQGIRVL